LITWLWHKFEPKTREIEVAEEEGMVSDGEDLLQRILIALGLLGYPIDTNHTAPSKQHPFTD